MSIYEKIMKNIHTIESQDEKEAVKKNILEEFQAEKLSSTESGMLFGAINYRWNYILPSVRVLKSMLEDGDSLIAESIYQELTGNNQHND